MRSWQIKGDCGSTYSYTQGTAAAAGLGTEVQGSLGSSTLKVLRTEGIHNAGMPGRWRVAAS